MNVTSTQSITKNIAVAIIWLLASEACRPVIAHSESLAPPLCQHRRPSDETIEWECRLIRKGESLEKLFGIHWEAVARFNRVDRRHAGPGTSIKVPKRIEDIVDFSPLPTIYPPARTDRQFILIDLAEEFLGAYEFGILRLSLPVAIGTAKHPTPTGRFRITQVKRRHASCLYTIEDTEIPYPMHYALLFYVTHDGIAFWIHGRDMPGIPASHGCIGLYDEAMQQEYYGSPKDPQLKDAQILYEWVLGNRKDDGSFIDITDGPRVLIIDSRKSQDQ